MMKAEKAKAAGMTVKDYGLEIEEAALCFSGVGDIIQAIRCALDEDSEFRDGLYTVERLVRLESDKLWETADKLQGMEV